MPKDGPKHKKKSTPYDGKHLTRKALQRSLQNVVVSSTPKSMTITFDDKPYTLKIGELKISLGEYDKRKSKSIYFVKEITFPKAIAQEDMLNKLVEVACQRYPGLLFPSQIVNRLNEVSKIETHPLNIPKGHPATIETLTIPPPQSKHHHRYSQGASYIEVCKSDDGKHNIVYFNFKGNSGNIINPTDFMNIVRSRFKDLTLPDITTLPPEKQQELKEAYQKMHDQHGGNPSNCYDPAWYIPIPPGTENLYLINTAETQSSVAAAFGGNPQVQDSSSSSSTSNAL